MQNDGTFHVTTLKLISQKKMSHERYFMSDEKHLHKTVHKDDKYSTQ